MNENFCKSLSDVISSKKVVVYGTGYVGSKILSILEELGKEVIYFLDQNPDKQKNSFYGYQVKPPEAIQYEDMSNTIVVIAIGRKGVVEDILTGFGLREGIEFVHGEAMPFEKCDVVDPFLGHARSSGINGFKAVGSYDKKQRNIICLGNSTTDYSMYEIKSWTEYLSELLKDNNINVNILNGGVIGYASSAELLKLIEYGLDLDPCLVISYSGTIDLMTYPATVHKSLGEIWENMESVIAEDKSKYLVAADHRKLYWGGVNPELDSAEYWYRNEMIMCSICRGFSIPFLGILQPSTFTRSSKERSLYEQRSLNSFGMGEYVKEQSEKAKRLVNTGKEENIMDFTSLFDKFDNVYFDNFHVFEQGNKIIAEAIYQTIKERQLLDIFKRDGGV